jgi:VWFA-related protein
MLRRPAVLLLLLSLILPAGPLPAQVPTFGATVEVRIANIDVVVTRKDGQHVEGLTGDDFTLLVDGKPEPITNFYEVRPEQRTSPVPESTATGATPTATPPPPDTTFEPRRKQVVALFVDTYSLDMRSRDQALASMQKFAHTNLRPGDEVLLAVWNRRLKIPLTLTSDLSRLDQEVESLRNTAPSGLARDRQISEMYIRSALEEALVSGGIDPSAAIRAAYGNAMRYASAFAEEQTKHTRNLAAAFEDLFRGIAGVDGKKIVVIIGENFPQYPGLGMFQYVNDVFSRYTGTMTLVVPQMMASERAMGDLERQLTRQANASEITLHAIYSGTTGNTETPAEGQDSPSDKIIADTLDFQNTAGTFSDLTRETGGVALMGSKNFEHAARTIAADLGSYYSLAYRVHDDKPASRVEVRTRDGSLVVRARRTFVAKPVEDQLSDRVSSRIYDQGASDSPEIRVTIGRIVRQSRSKMTLNVDIAFPSSLLTLIPQEGKRVGAFDIFVAAGDDDNRLSEVGHQKQDVAWPEGATPAEVSYHFELVVRNRPGTISVGVVDRVTRGIWTRRVEIPKG